LHNKDDYRHFLLIIESLIKTFLLLVIETQDLFPFRMLFENNDWNVFLIAPIRLVERT
jgi:hypothetical protein